uniref:Uncharacterized protein n=1 Tax=Meloidogyne enterolobii TaxID=390850 RepID=A0A6V7TWG2_MELEN|nr:unnamed protein product [Meloidogyne enterolobii]
MILFLCPQCTSLSNSSLAQYSATILAPRGCPAKFSFILMLYFNKTNFG